jgi:osmotically inducible protein OsmC
MKRFGSATWNGGLREGKGSVSTESRALETYPYTFFSRYGEKPGTNPEELLGAAHAACFTMSFVRLLGMANFVPEQVDSKSHRRTASARCLRSWRPSCATPAA